MDHFLGIDVSKAILDVAGRAAGQMVDAWSGSYPNSEAAMDRVVAALEAMAPTLIVVEATGGYERVVVARLSAAGLPVLVVNPKQVRAFAKATGQLAKTDRLDAGVLALFAERIRPELRPIPSAESA